MMFSLSRLSAIALLGATLLAAAPVLANEDGIAAGDLVLSGAWARASVTATGAAYLTIENRGAAEDVLLEVRSNVAEKVEIHDMSMDGMVMRMRKLERLPLPAGETMALAPGGLHIMLIRLDGPLAEGASVPLTLVFESAGAVDLSVPVRAAGHTGHGGH